MRLYPTLRIFQDYEKALELAKKKIILQRYGYNLNNVQNLDTILTPPFWIDMSKLFELYVLEKLKKPFPNEITNHFKANGNVGFPACKRR
jgi:5-methylcytosine-specific restriction enzyme subunit McrC